MKDLIAERDRKEKMERSIVKWWNVHYMTPEELEAEQAKEERTAAFGQESLEEGSDASAYETASVQQEDMGAAQEIIERLQREAAEDEARKQQEIERAKQEAEMGFNQATGAYSGMYGADGADGEHSAQINAILAEKDDALRDLIERTEEM